MVASHSADPSYNSEEDFIPIDKLLAKWTKARVDAINLLWNEIQTTTNDSHGRHLDNRDKIAYYSKHPQLIKKLQECQLESTKEVRTLSYKILQAFLSPLFSHEIFTIYNLEIFIIRTLVRDSRYDMERQQAFSLLFKFLDMPTGPEQFPLSIVRVVVSIADQLDDRLRNTALELLCELALQNTAIVSYAGGLKSLFNASLEGPGEMLKPIIRTFLYILDDPEGRCYVRPQLELENVISQFTDAFTAKGAYPIEKVETCAAIIQEFLSSWAGLYFFCVCDRQSIKSIIEALSLPDDPIRNLLLTLLQSLLGRMKEIERFPWAIQFQAICLMIFLDAGLIEALISIILDGSPSSCDLSFLLLSDVLTICANRLPKSYHEKVQTLPVLFAAASDFENEIRRQPSRDKLSKIFKQHLEAISEPSKDQSLNEKLLHAKSFEFLPDTLFINMEETHFKYLINESEVIGIKDYTKWNWNAIGELLKGSLLNPKRFDELVRTTKFVSRVLHFLKPSSAQFSELPNDENGAKIVSICSSLVCSLACTAAGYKYLIESRLLNDICEKLARMCDPSSFEPSIMFSKERMETTLVGEYFTILGDILRLPDGEEIFEEHNFWSIFYVVIQLRGKEEITKRILLNGNYARDGHIRIIFSKLLSSGYKEMRLFVTSHIRTILEKGTPGMEDWLAKVLVPQMFDPSLPVQIEALKLVRQCTTIPQILESIIAAEPDIEHVAEHDGTILMEFLKCSSGYHYLLHQGYIDIEIKYWFERGAYQYVLTADGFMNMENVFENTSDLDFITGYPPHFLGYLAKTKQGCEYLNLRKELVQLINVLINPSSLEQSENVLIKFKAAIWAVAHIGSSNSGLQLLGRLYPKHDMIHIILELSRKSDILSIRGQCMFSLCLFAQCSIGSDRLESLDCSYTGGICIPNTTAAYYDIPLWDYAGSWPTNRKVTFKPIDMKLSDTEKEVLKCIGNLSNHIVASANSKRLVQLKQTNPADFTSAFIYIQAMRILSDYPFKLQSRRFVQDLFDKFSWDIAALNTLLKYQGLNMSTPIVTTYKVNLAPIEPEKKVESNPITLSVQNLSFQQFPPAKIKKGFVV